MANSTLHFIERGKGTPVVLVHGFPFDAGIWEASLDRLSQHAHVLAPDLPGFGQSPDLPQRASMETYADALASWAKELDLGRVVLVGHSMAGYVAFALARKYPKMLAGLVPVCTRPGADTELARLARYSLANEVEQRGPEAVMDAMLPKLLSPASKERNPLLTRQVQAIILRQRTTSLRAAIMAMASRLDSTPTLGQIAVPTLVINGTEDAIMPASEVEVMLSHIPGAQHAPMPGSGHLPMMEDPDSFVEALGAFVKGLA